MTGHAGSTPAHGTCVEMLTAIKQRFPHIITVYGGVYPSYHAEEILRTQAAIDIIVRGEGEATAVDLLRTLTQQEPLDAVASIAFRRADGSVALTGERPPLRMDDYRIDWELLEGASPKGFDAYQCFGLGRAVILQFSRGCPHHCTYCGQHDFWVRWRHRDPAALVKLFATIRATDIVRDADILHLYKAAGIQYILMGIETTDPETLRAIRKGSTTRIDFQACGLLRRHQIFSIIGHIVGFGHERIADFFHAHRQLAVYDGDYLNAMFVTPHAWTPFAHGSRQRTVIETDQKHWDYRHQVLKTDHLKPWQLFTLVKVLEMTFHLRPRRFWRLLTQSSFSRQQFLWGLRHTGSVFLHEILSFARNRRTRRGTAPLADHQPALQPKARVTHVTISRSTNREPMPESVGG
jgi:anaerobic magnesium-protoporphyrin IX monomethyl ester cyclase